MPIYVGNYKINLNGFKRAYFGPNLVYSKGGGILPTEYQQVEYIQGTGTQWLDTGVAPNFGVKFEFELSNTTSSYGYSFGNNSSGNKELIGWNNNGRIYFLGNNSTLSPVPSANTYYNVIINLVSGASTLDINGYTTFSSAQTDIGNRSTWGLFCSRESNGSISFRNQKYKKFKAWNSGVLVRNMVPCYRNSDNEPGMYDLVNGIFYTNQGSGSFSVGPDVN